MSARLGGGAEAEAGGGLAACSEWMAFIMNQLFLVRRSSGLRCATGSGWWVFSGGPEELDGGALGTGGW